jgi:hypothetical protein
MKTFVPPIGAGGLMEAERRFGAASGKISQPETGPPPCLQQMLLEGAIRPKNAA